MEYSTTTHSAMASYSDMIVLEIDSTTDGVRSALSVLQEKRQSGQSAHIRRIQIQGTSLHFPQQGDPAYWEEIFNEIGSLASLHTLEVIPTGCSLPVGALANAIQRQTSQTLVSIKLSNILFQGDINDLARALANSKHLVNFCMCRCRILSGDAVVVPLIQALSTCPKLQTVDITSVAPFMSRDPLSSAMRELVASSSLQSLTLRDLELRGQWITNLFQGLKTNHQSHLKRLELHNNFNRLEKPGMEALGEMLLTNTTLERLSVSVANTTLLPITEALKVNRTLRYLCLQSSSRLTAEDSSLLVKMLEENQFLNDLRVRSALAHSRSIQFHLNLNRAGRGRLLEGAPQKKWVDTIIAFSDDLSVLFWLLSKNPTLIVCQSAVLSSKDDNNEPQTRKRQRSSPPSQNLSLYDRALSAVGFGGRPNKRRKLVSSSSPPV